MYIYIYILLHSLSKSGQLTSSYCHYSAAAAKQAAQRVTARTRSGAAASTAGGGGSGGGGDGDDGTGGLLDAQALRDELQGVTERLMLVTEDNARLKTERVKADLALYRAKTTLEAGAAWPDRTVYFFSHDSAVSFVFFFLFCLYDTHRQFFLKPRKSLDSTVFSFSFFLRSLTVTFFLVIITREPRSPS